MEYRSTLIRNVEIPSTLPSMDTLTDLRGSLILKDVTTKDDAITIEGDLLWRGYFKEYGDECLWEGAEYFSETICDQELRNAAPPLIEPQLLSLSGESLSDSTYRLSFDIRWYESAAEESAQSAPEEKNPAPPAPSLAKEKELKTVSQEKPPQTPEKKPEPILHPCSCHSAEPTPKTKTDLEENLERIDETWRETLKAINEPSEGEKPKAGAEQRPTESDNEAGDEVEIKCCPYSRFCLRYYRTQEGDELERIAERFSATVAKLKEYNKLDDPILSSGQMLRIP